MDGLVKKDRGNYEFLFVALGGALGAVARYAISLIPVKTGFPVLTLITNIIGAVLIGFMHKKWRFSKVCKSISSSFGCVLISVVV